MYVGIIYTKIFNINLWESVKELICFCERIDFVHLYAQRKLICVQKLLQAPSDVIRICAYMYTVSRENASKKVVLGPRFVEEGIPEISDTHFQIAVTAEHAVGCG